MRPASQLHLTIALLLLPFTSGSYVTTVTGAPPYANGVGSNAVFSNPFGISISPDEAFALVTDSLNSRIRIIDLATAVVDVIAGGERAGSANGFGTNSEFYSPSGIDISGDGTFALIVDRGNQLIRRLELSTAEVTALAGNKIPGSANGIGIAAQFNNPYGACISPTQEFALVADTSNNMIRKFDLLTSEVTTIAGRVSSGSTNGVGTNSLTSPTVLIYLRMVHLLWWQII
jgi:DNA-binding beta-propeller fold protein YncE